MTLGGEIVNSIFVKTEQQKTWLEKLHKIETKLKNTSAQTDELAIFPLENIQELIQDGLYG